MPIRFACPVCKTEYHVGDGDAGKKAECKSCGQRIQVPSPPRPKTVLGEFLPDASSPARPAPREPHPIPRPSAPTSGAIHFNCQNCRTSYTVNPSMAGTSFECQSCWQSMTVPGHGGEGAIARPAPRRPAPEPVYHQEPESPPEPYPVSLPVEPPAPGRPRSANGPASRVIASLGAGMLLVGLFLPMVHGPMGVWLSFIDLPLKAVTLGFAATEELRDIGPMPENRPRPDPGRKDGKEAEKPGWYAHVVVVAIGSLLYPIVILAVLGFVGLQILRGRTVKGYFIAGIFTFTATLAYALSLLSINMIDDLRMVMVLVSPGFGWAVLLMGGFLLTGAGVIRSGSRD